MKKIWLKMITGCLIVAFSMTGCGNSEQPSKQKTYDNPVYAPVFADPSVVRHEGVYYAFATEDFGEWRKNDDPLDNESLVRCVPILKSTDMVTWHYESCAFQGLSKPKWGTNGANVWAPDVVRLADRYVMYYSLSTWGDPNPGIGVAVADHPAGPWEDRGELFRSLSIGVDNSIDPAVFVGQDDKVYMIWGSFRGLFGVELSEDGLALKNGVDYAKENKVLVAGVVGSWNGATYEAPYVLNHDNNYYLFVSSGSCCEGFQSSYHVRVGRSEHPLGPYTDHNGEDMRGVAKGRIVLEGSEAFVGVGHNAIAQDDEGNDYIFYHAFDKSADSDHYGTANRRSLMIDKLIWTADGWPEVVGKFAGKKGLIAPIIKERKGGSA